jgi:glycosyltransferase involved in cell wall biosynthesis
MRALSAVIITYNEAQNIGRCIDSLAGVADEVVVLDSFSTDGTVAIARQKGAVLFQQAFAGYITQKNHAIGLATHHFVLSLDADEALSPDLAAAIREVKAREEVAAYSMNRCSWYRGRFIRHGLWYPDRKLRLFDRRTGMCGGFNPHDKIVLLEEMPVIRLKGDLLHYTYATLEAYRERNAEVSRTAAQSLFEQGVKKKGFALVINPVWAFLNGYILRLGFLDGRDGLTIAWYCAMQCYRKHRWLRLLHKGNAKVVVQSLISPPNKMAHSNY